jgi:hypothetical protein
MPIYFGILNFGVLALVAHALKQEGKLGPSAAMGLAAWAVLAWGVLDFLWHLAKG